MVAAVADVAATAAAAANADVRMIEDMLISSRCLLTARDGVSKAPRFSCAQRVPAEVALVVVSVAAGRICLSERASSITANA